MSNFNTQTIFTSSSGLSTANVTELFPVADVPGANTMRASVLVTFTAETLFQNGVTAQSVEYPVFAQRAGTFIPVRFLVQPVSAIVFGGGAAATATLLGNPSWKTSVVLPVVTAGAVVTTNDFAAAVSLTTAGGTGVAALKANQYSSNLVTAIASQQQVVKAGQSLYLKFNSGGTVAADTTVTGSFRVFIFGFEQVGA